MSPLNQPTGPEEELTSVQQVEMQAMMRLAQHGARLNPIPRVTSKENPLAFLDELMDQIAPNS